MASSTPVNPSCPQPKPHCRGLSLKIRSFRPLSGERKRGTITRVFFTEFQGIGVPSLAVGRVGDVYLDRTPKRYELYARFREKWIKWPGQIDEINLVIHPQYPDRALWCDMKEHSFGWFPKSTIQNVPGPSTTDVLSCLLAERLKRQQSNFKKRKQVISQPEGSQIVKKPKVEVAVTPRPAPPPIAKTCRAEPEGGQASLAINDAFRALQLQPSSQLGYSVSQRQSPTKTLISPNSEVYEHTPGRMTHPSGLTMDEHRDRERKMMESLKIIRWKMQDRHFKFDDIVDDVAHFQATLRNTEPTSRIQELPSSASSAKSVVTREEPSMQTRPLSPQSPSRLSSPTAAKLSSYTSPRAELGSLLPAPPRDELSNNSAVFEVPKVVVSTADLAFGSPDGQSAEMETCVSLPDQSGTAVIREKSEHIDMKEASKDAVQGQNEKLERSLLSSELSKDSLVPEEGLSCPQEFDLVKPRKEPASSSIEISTSAVDKHPQVPMRNACPGSRNVDGTLGESQGFNHFTAGGFIRGEITRDDSFPLSFRPFLPDPFTVRAWRSPMEGIRSDDSSSIAVDQEDSLTAGFARSGTILPCIDASVTDGKLCLHEEPSSIATDCHISETPAGERSRSDDDLGRQSSQELDARGDTPAGDQQDDGDAEILNINHGTLFYKRNSAKQSEQAIIGVNSGLPNLHSSGSTTMFQSPASSDDPECSSTQMSSSQNDTETVADARVPKLREYFVPTEGVRIKEEDESHSALKSGFSKWPSRRLEESHLKLIYHITKVGTRFCRLCLQMIPMRVVEFPLQTALDTLLGHCESEHAVVCEILLSLSAEQLDEMDQQVNKEVNC